MKKMLTFALVAMLLSPMAAFAKKNDEGRALCAASCLLWM